MKRFLAIILIIVTLCAFAACNKDDEKLDLSQCVSYAQTHLYTGENASFSVKVEIGKKEELFNANGKTENVMEFATVKVTPLNLDLANKAFSFELIGEGLDVKGDLKKDVVSNAYVASVDLGENKDKITGIKIMYDDKKVDIPLTNQLTGMLTWQQVLDIAAKEFETEILANLDEDGKLPREICIKFIKDKRNPDAPYYWYVSFIAENGSYWALLLDPETGKVASKKA